MTGPRPIPDPVVSAPALIVFCLATLAACFVAGYQLAALAYERLTLKGER